MAVTIMKNLLEIRNLRFVYQESSVTISIRMNKVGKAELVISR